MASKTRFASKDRRLAIFALAASVIFDVVMTFALARFLQRDDYEGGGFLVLLAVLWIGTALLGIYAFLKGALFTWLFKNEAGSAVIAKMLRDDGMPAPDDFEKSPGDYLSRVSEDADCPPSVRNRAAFLAGEFAGYVHGADMLKSMQFTVTWERALASFKENR